MFKSMIGERVTVVVASRGDNLLEYVGFLSSESEDAIELTDVDVAYLAVSIQRAFGAANMGKYKDNLNKVIINKRYVISCDTLR